MLRLSLSLLLVSLVLGMDHSIDDDFTRRTNVNPESALTNNFRQRKRQQQPHIEIKEENAGRYFRRRPQTTTVSSIFSMKVENESQHVYPNMRPLDLHIQSKQEESNMTDISTPTPLQNFPRTANSNNRRPNNVRRRVPYTKIRRPSFAQTPTLIIQETEKTTEQVVISTTTAPIVETTEKEQEKIVSSTSDSNFSNEDSSLERLHPTISQIPEAFIQRMKETAEEVGMSTSDAPLVVSTTAEPEKLVITPSTAHVSKVVHYVKRRRPLKVQKTALPVNQQKEANEQATDSTTAAPVTNTAVTNAAVTNAAVTNAAVTNAAVTNAAVTNAAVTNAPVNNAAITNAAIPQDKIVLSPFASYVSAIVSMARPKYSRPLTRGSYKYNRNDIQKDQFNIQASNLDSNSSQLTSTIKNTPPPVPTLSPWYDGFGK